MNQMEIFFNNTYSIMDIPIIQKPKQFKRYIVRKEKLKMMRNKFGDKFIDAIVKGNDL